MKNVLVILFLIAFTVNTYAEEEKISFQTKPFLYFVPISQKIILESTGAENNTGMPLILDLEFKYLLNKRIILFINPVFALGFWSYTPIDGDNMVVMDYYLSNCLDFSIGIQYKPFGTGLRGMYIGAFSVIGWGFVTYGSDGSSHEKEKIADFLNLGFITEIGYDWIFNNGFSISLGVGISKLYQIPKVSIITAVNSPLIGNDMYHYGSIHGIHFLNLPIDPRIKFSIGYSF